MTAPGPSTGHRARPPAAGSARFAPTRARVGRLVASGVKDAGHPVPPGAGRRLAWLAGFGALWCLVLLGRLVELQVVRHETLAAKGARQHAATVEVEPLRGGLLDRAGRELALSTPVESIGIFSDQVRDPRAAAADLAEATGVDAEDLRSRIEKGGFQWVKRLAGLADTERARALGRSDLHFETERRRFYPHGSVAAHVLGTVGIDHHGQSGLEHRFEKELRGTPGLAVWFYDARQERYGRQHLRPAIGGKDLLLTLDLDIQAVADMELERAIRETKSEAGTVVLMEPRTGDVVAMSSWPRFDPNSLSRTPEDLLNHRDFATSRLVEPGSTFKVLTATAALEEGLIDLSETFDCEMGATYVGRRRIRDHHPYGMMTMPQVIIKSSNVGIIKIGYRLGEERMHSYVRRFGFGRPTQIGLPGEAHGLVRPVDRWTYSSLASLAMGQEVGVTAIQMARLFAAVANGGLAVQPRIVRGFRDHEGREAELAPDPPQRVVSAKTAATMRSILKSVVKEGTGRRAAIPGYTVGGKTGTAQMINPVSRSYRDGVYMASFCGFAPVENPALVGVAMVYNPRGQHYYGGLVAAPLFSTVVRSALRLMGVPPTQLPERRPRPARPEADRVLVDFIEGRVGEPDDSVFQDPAQPDGTAAQPGIDAEPAWELPPARPSGPEPRRQPALPDPDGGSPRGVEAIAAAPEPLPGTLASGMAGGRPSRALGTGGA